jgi:dTDP-4-amino-4,6-dideoxygalactose transaminase
MALAAASPLPRFRIYTRPATYATVLRAVVSGKVEHGDDVARLEQALGERFGVKHVVATSQARLAIYLAVKHAVAGGRRKIVLSPYTIFDVINMVVAAGGIPVFADIDRRTCNLDPASADALVDADTAAVMVTHLHGLATNMDGLLATCARAGIPLIEDAAQSFGARIGDRPVGAIGQAGIVSFGLYKNITGFYGGALLTNDAALAEASRAELAGFPFMDRRFLLQRVSYAFRTDVATHPLMFRTLMFRLFRMGTLRNIAALNQRVDPERDPTLRTELPAHYRCRITPLQARVVLLNLSRIEEETRQRVEIAKVYARELEGAPKVLLPPLRTDGSHIYNYYPIQVAERRSVLEALLRRNRDLAVQHLRNCADLPCFAAWKRDCPNTRQTASEVLLLPTYPRYGLDHAVATARALRAVLTGGR